MSKRILVTGVGGFMASHLAEQLANEGHNVLGVDNLSIGLKSNIPENIGFVKLDLRDAKATEKVVADFAPEIVYHLAAWAHEGLSQFMPRLITENNYNAFLNLIIPAINNGVERVVVTSSMSVYGSQKPPFHEELPRLPVDVYGVAKASMEACLEVLADVHGFEYTIIRPHNVYGPRQMLHDPYRNVVGLFMNRVMQGKPPVIYGSGEQQRAFSYIDDFTPYILKAGFLPETNGEIINIGPTEEFSINQLSTEVLKAFDREDLEPVYVADRPREVKHAWCTNDKAQRLLGYKTSVSFAEGVRKMAEWAKTQGPQEFKYLDGLELSGDKVPQTWSKKMM